MFCGLADRKVVFLGPAFLQAYDVGGRVESGDLAADFCEARIAVFGDEFEAPAVEGEDTKVGGEVEDVVVVEVALSKLRASKEVLIRKALGLLAPPGLFRGEVLLFTCM